MTDETTPAGTAPAGSESFSTLTLKETVATQVIQAAPSIRDAVVDALAKPEIKSRTQLLVDGYNRVAKIRTDLNKIDRPDVDPKDREGKSLGNASYSDTRVKEIKKLSDELTKWEGAIAKAWADPQDFKKLKELLGNKTANTASEESDA